MSVCLGAKKIYRIILGSAGGAVSILALCTWLSIQDVPSTLKPNSQAWDTIKVVDRFGSPLSIKYGRGLNVSDYVSFGEISDSLKQAFLAAEDKRFYEHSGVDWRARLNAVLQNIKARRIVRGASTITEQVVRILNPRPRTLWARWIEGFEAARLEKMFSKEEIFEFYLNQVPYGSERRGIVQASRFYFGRDLSTLNETERLALAVLVRAPSRLSPSRNPQKLLETSARVRARMVGSDHVNEENSPLTNALSVSKDSEELEEVPSFHFVRYARGQGKELPLKFLAQGRLVTTLDKSLQRFATKILNERLKTLKSRNVRDGAVLIVNHEDNEILAWANNSLADNLTPDSFIDAVLAPRQPGSALKPFLYALALERGWTASTLLDDEPTARAVGVGMHAYRNYSRTYYGKVRLRDALANSLNVPAIKTIGELGVQDFFSHIKKFGFASLTEAPAHYGEGLALGNGEVSLLELVSAYSVLARGGITKHFTAIKGAESERDESTRVLSRESAALISNILSDRVARRLEFGSSGVLNFPQLTSIKTGTSSDFKDVWAVGYSGPYTVGVWMGNLNREPTRDLTGSTGPALILRSLFHELSQRGYAVHHDEESTLLKKRICSVTGHLLGAHCPVMDEWYKPGSEPHELCNSDHTDLSSQSTSSSSRPSIMVPTPGLQVAMDPRIPDTLEALPLKLKVRQGIVKTRWYVDGELYTETEKTAVSWNLKKGAHSVWAEVLYRGATVFEDAEPVNFIVK